MDRALSMPELLGTIFLFSDQSSQARCARVCRLWSPIALETLWKVVYSMKDLFSLISPLYVWEEDLESKARTLQLRDWIRSESWTRFNRYASLVRTLFISKLPMEGEFDVFLDNAVLHEIAYKRLTLSLLPNLVDLHIDASSDTDLFNYAGLFLSQKVTRLFVSFKENCDEQLESLCDLVAARAPGLTYFKLRANSVQWQSEEEIASVGTLLSSLRSLDTVIFSANTMVSSFASELSKLPHLRTISFENALKRRDVIAASLGGFVPVLGEGAFPRLSTLELTASLLDLCSFFGNKFAPHNITKLFVQTPLWEKPDNLRNFFVTVSQTCRELADLAVDDIYDVYNSAPILSSDENEPVTIYVFEPLLALPRLTRFMLAFHRKLEMKDADLTSLVSRWPKLESLKLAWQPIMREQPLLSFRVFPMIAPHCHNLRELALYVDGTDVPNVPMNYDSHRETPYYQQRPFARLHSLSFGTSPIIADAVPNIAISLGNLGISDSILNIGHSWRQPFMNGYAGANPVTQRMVHSWHVGLAMWEEVRRMLSVVGYMKHCESFRSRILLAEISELKEKVRVLDGEKKISF
ncbi:hypothetical protein DFH11DRAFT_1751534 [Phellopilus nigrolimitatus]|nr:hypothetical protein DFH11DRAFT_1751534 [Phellopilus nigrolimitatus]